MNTAIPNDIRRLAEALDTEVDVTVTTITERERTPANAEKVAILKDLLDYVPDDEVDKYFLEMLNIAIATGVNLKSDPVSLLQAIERKHQPKPEPVVL